MSLLKDVVPSIECDSTANLIYHFAGIRQNECLVYVLKHSFSSLKMNDFRSINLLGHKDSHFHDRNSFTRLDF